MTRLNWQPIAALLALWKIVLIQDSAEITRVDTFWVTVNAQNVFLPAFLQPLSKTRYGFVNWNYGKLSNIFTRLLLMLSKTIYASPPRHDISRGFKFGDLDGHCSFSIIWLSYWLVLMILWSLHHGGRYISFMIILQPQTVCDLMLW